MEDFRIDPREFHQPLPKGEGKSLTPLELLPEREWIYAQISQVEYRYSKFNGEIQYMKIQDGEIIKGPDHQPIPRKEFNITFNIIGHELPNGEPRKAWLRLGASMNVKANLPIFLFNVGIKAESLTPAQLKEKLEGMNVKLQLKNKVSNEGKTYQNVIFDAVKSAGPQKDYSTPKYQAEEPPVPEVVWEE